jgi:D-inositol-3-phosphate glycosyltransferase
MRVDMVSEHASPLAVLGGVDAGGQNVHVAALATALARLGVNVTVFTRRDDRRLPRRVRLAPRVVVEHVDAGPPEQVPKDELFGYMDGFADVLARRWAVRPPDVVHSHFWMSGHAALAAAPPGVPVVHTFHALGGVKRRHQGADDTSPPQRVDVERDIVQRAARIIATCSDEVFELSRMARRAPRASIVPCGVDLRRFRPGGQALAGTPGRQRLVVVSRLVPRKGIAECVEALADIPGAELLVAGGPPAEELADDSEARRLLGLARAHGVADRFELLGRVDNTRIPDLLRSADLVLCTPWYEPFGMTALEAMACGVPVVASAVGGLVDSVVDGETGVLVPPRDPPALAAAVRQLLADELGRVRLGRAGVDRARRRYGWERIAAATLDAYVEAIHRHAGSGPGQAVEA